MKLTALKMSRGALARSNSVFSRDGRFDFSALVGCIFVGVGRVGDSMIGVGVGTGKGSCSCKSGKGESEDDFELHFAFFGCNTEHLSTEDCFLVKKVGKPSNLYTSRGRTARVNINGEPNLKV